MLCLKLHQVWIFQESLYYNLPSLTFLAIRQGCGVRWIMHNLSFLKVVQWPISRHQEKFSLKLWFKSSQILLTSLNYPSSLYLFYFFYFSSLINIICDLKTKQEKNLLCESDFRAMPCDTCYLEGGFRPTGGYISNGGRALTREAFSVRSKNCAGKSEGSMCPCVQGAPLFPAI